jgi:hypothetical protein
MKKNYLTQKKYNKKRKENCGDGVYCNANLLFYRNHIFRRAQDLWKYHFPYDGLHRDGVGKCENSLYGR